MTCSKCGSGLSQDATQCPQCGQPVEAPVPPLAAPTPPPGEGILCECGAVSTRQHHFCVACGARLAREEKEIPAPTPSLNVKTELPAWLRRPTPPEAVAGGEAAGPAPKQKVIPLPLHSEEPPSDSPAPERPVRSAILSAGPTRRLDFEMERAVVAPPPEPVVAAPPVPEEEKPAPVPLPPLPVSATPVVPPPALPTPVAAAPTAPVLPPVAVEPAPAAPARQLSAPVTSIIPQFRPAVVERPPEPEKMVGKLKSIRSGKTYTLDKPINTMGRRSPTEGIEPDIDCTIMDEEFFCSRRHARVLVQDGVYFAEDLGSANGTYLNNLALAPNSPSPMNEGDRLRLGNVEFVFTLGLEARRAVAGTPFASSVPDGPLAEGSGLVVSENGVRLRVDTQLMEKHLRTIVHRAREVEIGNNLLQVDLSSQVLGIHMPDEPRADQPLMPTLPLVAAPSFLSASALGYKARAFNMGLWGAVELAAEAGFGAFPGKAQLLKGLARMLSAQTFGDMGNIPEVVFGSIVLGEIDSEPPRGLMNNVINRVTEFRAKEEISRPVDFYTLSKELEAVYKQDRMLETPLGGQQAVYDFVRMVGADRNLRDAYEACLSLIHSLSFPTNPAHKDLGSYLHLWDEGRMEAETSPVSFFPPRQTHSEHLVRRLLGDGAQADAGEVLEEVMREMRAGRTTLTPTDESGWFDYQTWALEPLVSPERMPEANQLHQAGSYRKQLQDLFKDQLLLAREAPSKVTDSHASPVVHNAHPSHGVNPLILEPQVTVEPAASYYLRMAVSYRFVRLVLEALFGGDGVSAMRRTGSHGTLDQNVGEELMFLESLFYGAHVVACQELGLSTDTRLPVGSGQGADMDASRFMMWMRSLDQDEEMRADIRQMVPIGYDAAKRKIKVWMSLGWASRPIRFYFFEQPIATVLDRQTRQPATGVPVHFQEVQHELWYPVTAIAYVDRLMPNDRFRALCDATPGIPEVLNALAQA